MRSYVPELMVPFISTFLATTTAIITWKTNCTSKHDQAKERRVELTLFALTPTKSPHQKEVEIYQSLPQVGTVPSQFLIPQLFQVFDVFSHQASWLQVVQSLHI